MPQFLASLLTILVVLGAMTLAVAYLSLLERKVASWVQDRIGPNRTGLSFGQGNLLERVGLGWVARAHFMGLGQPLADGLKFLMKEDYDPPGVEKTLFCLAPVLTMIPAMAAWAVIPFGGTLHLAGWTWPHWLPVLGGGAVGPMDLLIAGAPIDVGVLYILALGSVAVYGVVLAGYASNNKYAFLGGLRATAQMISYEIPLGLSVLVILLVAGATSASDILNTQTAGQGLWNLCYMPLLAVVFFTCNLAETNRTPFDLAEAEQELVGGYHTEYSSSMKFAMFMMGEYFHVITAMSFFTLIFLGGWSISPLGLWPDLPLTGGIGLVVLKMAVFGAKVLALIFLVMMVRWTIPRFRFDQLMRLAWRGLIPTALALLLTTGAIVYLRTSLWWLTAANVAVAAAVVVIGPLVPAGAPVNRRVPLKGSRFSPPA